MAEGKKIKEEVVNDEKKIKKTDIERFPEVEISENTQTILESRYLKKDLKTKKPQETARDLFKRVAISIAAGSVNSEPNIAKDELEQTEEIFYEMMVNRDFLPNSPTLMNAGRELPNLSACFVLPIEDSMDGIFNTLKDAALIHKSGGGTGFDFSELRSSGSNVKTTAGSASGPISFMSVFNAATETIKQGGVRRGANMGILRVDHPDIVEFISCKEDTSKFTNFNISVAITDDFMDAYKKGSDYNLYNPDKSIHSRMSAVEIMEKIVDHSWSTGEPGIVFIDKINKKATLPGVGKIAATNPCGEQPLLPHEACNLGSINLSNFYEKEIGDVNWERLKVVVHNAILFLDNVIEVGKFPIQKIHDTVLANRKIALNTSLQKAFEDFGYGLRKIADGDYDYISKIKKERKLKTEFTPLLSDLSKMAIEIEAQMTKREKVELELIEIGEHLEEKVKERTEELNKAKNDLLSLSREAGMADIATDVIHNIGNALNSITTNTDFIYSYIKDLKVPVIDKIAGLFEKNKENFGDFISKDATGKKIPIVIRQFSGYLQSIKDNSLKDIKNIKRDITHIQNVIDNQQTYAKNILVMELYSPAEIMNEAIRMNKNILGKHNVSIELKYSDVSVIKTDKHKILQVLLNLFSNSKFAFENTPRDNRNIICFVRKENNFLEYEIKDNGIGIEGKNLKKIFNYGFTTRENGHGFGLHNSANTIKQLKGELVATSDGIGKGASFIVKIPY